MWPAYPNSLEYFKYFSGCTVCVSNGSLNLIWFILAHVFLYFCNSCPCLYALVGENKLIHLLIYLQPVQVYEWLVILCMITTFTGIYMARCLLHDHNLSRYIHAWLVVSCMITTISTTKFAINIILVRMQQPLAE